MKTALALLFAFVVVDGASPDPGRRHHEYGNSGRGAEDRRAAPERSAASNRGSIKGEYNVGAAVVHRAKTAGQELGGALAHSQITEVYYIISGNGTLVTGGTLENAKDRPTTARTSSAPVPKEQKS